MPLIQWGEWRPDVADYQGVTTSTINNVLPRGDGYGPAKDFSALSGALYDTCRGAFYALKSDGTVAVFAGTEDRLWLLNNTDLSWKPVSKVADVTISMASPGVVTLTAHGFAVNDPVVFSNTGGGLPAEITAGTVYYVKTTPTDDTFTISATVGGAAINTSGAGTGTHHVTHIYTGLSADMHWQFAQFGNYVIAVQENIAPQVYDLSSSTAFANLGGSPPNSAYVQTVGKFVVLSGLFSNPYRIQWSGLNEVDNYTSGVNSSDFQDFPDGGIVRGVAGGEFGVVFQDQAIRRMVYVPGSPLVFQIDRIAQDQGLFAPYSIIRSGELVFFYTAHGFHRIGPEGGLQNIGRERVDRTFYDDLDKTDLKLFIGAHDPRSTRVYWAYKSTGGATGLYDKIIGYDHALNRWFTLSMSGEYIVSMAQPGITLESLDAIYPSLDDMEVSLDSFAVATLPLFAQFNSAHKLGFFTGDNLEARMETSEQGTDGRRVKVTGFRPITDAATLYGRVSYRDTQQADAFDTAEALINSRTGRVDLVKSTRYTRMKVRIPAGTQWEFCAGVEPFMKPDGTQ